MLCICLYRHFYRQKTTALPGAGDALDLRGGYSSASIVNYRMELESPFKATQPYVRSSQITTINHDIGAKSCITIDQSLHLHMTWQTALRLHPSRERRMPTCTR